jgi:hypothetical protein
MSRRVGYGFIFFYLDYQFPHTRPLQDLSESFTCSAVALEMVQALLHDLYDRSGSMDAEQFSSQTRMPAQFATQQDPIPGSADPQGSCWANPDALSAGKAFVHVYPWGTPVEDHGVFPAGLHTGKTLAARFFSDHRPARPNEADIYNLWPGTGIWAVRNGDSKLMVHLQGAIYSFPQEFLQVSLGEPVFQLIGESV